MILPGHMATALIAARLCKTDVRTTLIAAFFPDGLDKGLHWVARLTPSDRLWGHTVWTLLGTSAVAWIMGHSVGRPALGRAWLVGYVVHFLGDVTAPMAPFYPLSKRGYHQGARFREVLQGEREAPWRLLAIEGLLALAAAVLEIHLRRRRRG
jgi:hypothetical protein